MALLRRAQQRLFAYSADGARCSACACARLRVPSARERHGSGGCSDIRGHRPTSAAGCAHVRGACPAGRWRMFRRVGDRDWPEWQLDRHQQRWRAVCTHGGRVRYDLQRAWRLRAGCAGARCTANCGVACGSEHMQQHWHSRHDAVRWRQLPGRRVCRCIGAGMRCQQRRQWRDVLQRRCWRDDRCGSRVAPCWC